MSIGDTKRRLYQWGNWAAGGHLLGFPMLSAFMRIHMGHSAIGEPPPDILRTDHIIARAEIPFRKILIRQYCTRGSVREKAARARIAKSTYWDLLDEAVWFVHTEYDKPDPVAISGQKRYITCDSRLGITKLRPNPLTGA